MARASTQSAGPECCMPLQAVVLMEAGEVLARDDMEASRTKASELQLRPGKASA